MPRAIPAVFVGYPPGMKASRDVIFHENIFPFHKVTLEAEVNYFLSTFVLPKSFNDDGSLMHDVSHIGVSPTLHSGVENQFPLDVSATDDIVTDIVEPNSHSPAGVVIIFILVQ